jgi:hypothetical protein
MLATIALGLMAMLVLGAVELWLFWWLGERNDRRRSRVVTHLDDRARCKPTPKHGRRVRRQPPVNPRRVPVRR